MPTVYDTPESFRKPGGQTDDVASRWRNALPIRPFQHEHAGTANVAGLPEVVVKTLLYITSEDCHLCDHGRAVLDRLGVLRREFTSESAEAADLAAHGIPLAFLPVLTDDDRVIAYGRFSARRLAQELGLS
ncbi:MAG TPA: hypothetical protein VND83_09520 [Acidimicrobiales bacterium]|nr:hypothetical protein [Acidimicrobiales bacterium]